MSEKVIISVDQELDPIKQKNLFITIVLSDLIGMVFYFSVVFLFTFQLKSVALVGFFLGVGNLFSFLLDISVGIVQKYFKSKTLFIISFVSQIIAMLIFVNFTLEISSHIKELTTPENKGVITDLVGFFLGNGLNIFLLLLASFCMGLTWELQDVTLISYILNKANPSQYSSIFSQKNIAAGIGDFFGLIISGFILTFSPTFIIFITIFVIILMIYFTNNFFDNGTKTINLQDIYKFKVYFQKNGLEEMKNDLKDNLVKTVNKIELKNIISSSKYIFIKPLTIKSGLTFKLLVDQTKKEFITTYKILSNTNNSLVVYWSLVIGMTFGFWDTFASTFLISFLDNLWTGWGYILLGVIAIPAFGLQDILSKLAKKIGEYNVANIGLVLSGVSLIILGFFADSTNLLFIMSLALINSTGYASCMCLSQSLFLESYNKSFAEYNNLKEIDANASAAPAKIVQNLANVFGLFFGGIILGLLQYKGFFIIFGGLIMYILYWSFKNKKTITKDLSE